MSKDETLAKFVGDHHAFLVKKVPGILSTSYYVVRDDGKHIGSYPSKGTAFSVAKDHAGPRAFESNG